MSALDRETALLLLKRLGWTKQSEVRGSLEIWDLAGSNVFADTERTVDPIFLPISPTAADFESLLDRAFDSLMRLYGNQLPTLLQLARLRTSEHLYELDVKRATPNLSGLIQWQLGVEMVESARGLLSSAAKASSSPRKRFANAQSVISEEYLKRCYMGQTQIGSYVVTALTPARETFPTSRGESEASRRQPTILGHDITQTLIRGLEAVSYGISEYRSSGRIEAFDELVDHGVSFELLSAIEKLTGNADAAITVEFSADDSLVASQAKEFPFDPSDAVIIAQAREFFALAPLPVPSKITGEVILLKSSSADAIHQIKLRALVNREARTVAVKLSEEQYRFAVSAHGSGNFFTVDGELEQRSRGMLVNSPGSVRIEPDKIPNTTTSAADSTVALW